jgi:predicted transcriptional regulator
MIEHQPVLKNNNSPAYLEFNFNEFHYFNKNYNLDQMDYLILSSIIFRLKKYNSYNFTNDYLAELFKTSSSTITRIIKKLKLKKLITTNEFKNYDIKLKKIITTRYIYLTNELASKVMTSQIDQTLKKYNSKKSPELQPKKDKFMSRQFDKHINNKINNNNLDKKDIKIPDKKTNNIVFDNLKNKYINLDTNEYLD